MLIINANSNLYTEGESYEAESGNGYYKIPGMFNCFYWSFLSYFSKPDADSGENDEDQSDKDFGKWQSGGMHVFADKCIFLEWSGI